MPDCLSPFFYCFVCASPSSLLTTLCCSAMQISGGAYQLLLMQEDSQLTDRSLQAALSITADAITSAVQAGKGVDSVYATELLVMTARGLQLSSAATGTGGSSAGRRLMATPVGYTAFVASGGGESRGTLLGNLDALADLLDDIAGPGIGWITAPSTDLSVSVVKDIGSAYVNYTVAVGPQTTNGTSTQAADLNSADNAQVTFLVALTPSGSSVPIWLQLVQDPAVLVTSTPSPTETDVNAFKAAAWNDTLPRVAPPLLNLTVLTPAVRVKLPQLTDEAAALPCAAAEANATVDCRMVIKLPVVNTDYVDTSRLLLCLRIDGNGNLVAAASEEDGWQMYGNYSTDGTLRCSTSLQGTYVIAAVDPVDTTHPVVTPEPPAPVNTTLNVTSPDGSNTTTNTSLGNDSLSDTSPSPVPEASPSPSPEEPPSPSPQVVEASPSPSPQMPLQGLSQTPASKLSGLLINLGAVQHCTVSARAPCRPSVKQPPVCGVCIAGM